MHRWVQRCALAAAFVLIAAQSGLAFSPGSPWTTDALGSTAIFHMKTAPFPHPSRRYTDDRVMIFVPAGFRAGATVDVIVHYHGFNGEITASDAAHHYREQLALSKKNAVLLEPQGPLHAADGAGGKHSDPDGFKRFLAEALEVLVREGAVEQGTTLGTVLVSGHSGAYNVISDVLDHGGVEVTEVHLHDSLYGQEARFEAWARGDGHKLVSTCTRTGGTAANNVDLANRLEQDGVTVARDDSDASLATAQATFVLTDVAHNDVTHARHIWTRSLEHSRLSDLGVPRPRLLSVTRATGGDIVVAWYPVRSGVCQGYRLSWSPDGAEPFERILDETSLDPGTSSVELVWGAGEAYFRLTAVDDQGNESDASCVQGVRPDGSSRVLVVDGFQRTSGRFHAGAHAFCATAGNSVAAAGRSFDECSCDAVKDGSVALSSYASVIWLAGDQSVTDAALDHFEEARLTSYVAAGGKLFLSGSEVGYTLDAGSSGDRAFLANVLGASLAGDTDTTRSVSGTGALAGASATFGGASAAYAPASPDFLRPSARASTVLTYGDGRTAAVATTSGVLYMGFPFETIDTREARDSLVARALGWLESR